MYGVRSVVRQVGDALFKSRVSVEFCNVFVQLVFTKCVVNRGKR